MDEEVVGAKLAYEFLLELQCRKYTEMTFADLLARPLWRMRIVYRYHHAMRAKYGLEMSREFVN